MLTEQEKEDLVNRTLEKVLLRLPEVVGNLMKELGAKTKLLAYFQRTYPETKKNPELVAKMLEQAELENPGLDYKQLLDKVGSEVSDKLVIADKINRNGIL